MPLKWDPAVLFPDNTEDYVWHLHNAGIMKGWIRKCKEKLGERRIIFSQLVTGVKEILLERAG